MNQTPGITKYYVGIGVLLFLTLGSLVYAFGQAGNAKTDRATNNSINDMSSKLDIYVSSNGVPNSLDQANIKNVPSSIKYTRLSGSEYKICANYKVASSGFDGGWGSLFGGFFGSATPQSDSSTKEYFDSYQLQYAHKKGDNCETVKPYTYNSNNLNNSGASINYSSPTSSDSQNNAGGCTAGLSKYNVSGDVTVNRVDTATKTIYFEPTGQFVFDYTSNSSSNVPTISSKTYSDKTVFCNGQTLKATDVSAIKAGDQVSIYLNSSSDSSLGQIDTTYQFGN